MGTRVIYGSDQEVVVEHEVDGVTIHATIRPDESGAPRIDAWSINRQGITTRTIRQHLQFGPLFAVLQHTEPFCLSVAGLTNTDDRAESHRGGRVATSDAAYALWAFRYLQHCNRGTRSPVKDLATEHALPLATVSHLLHRARERSLLLGNGHGRPGGRLSPRARELLGLERD